MSHCARRVLVTMVLVAGVPAAAFAQSNVETNAAIQFDFLSPGARSLGLGGAFLAIADDATTAFTNPAGLREVSRTEVSFEVRFRGFETPYTVRGHGFGSPSGIGTDTVAGLIDATSDDRVVSPSFFSFVVPRPKWAIAGYRHELARFKSSLTTEGPFVGPTTSVSRLFPAQGAQELTIVDYGLSASYNITDRASIGAGIVLYDFKNDAKTTRFDFIGFSAPTYTTVANIQTQSGDSTAVSGNVGFLLKPTDQVQLAAVYRRGAAFDVRVTNTTATNVTLVDETAKFNVPDVFGFGLAVRPGGGLRVAFDVNRVMYSQLTVGFVDLFEGAGSRATDYTVPDGTEVHVGAEYLLTNLRTPVAFRAGVWRDPAHAITYTGSEVFFQTLFRERDKAQIHYAFGSGFVVQKFEVNAGVDIAKLVTTFSLSTVVRF